MAGRVRVRFNDFYPTGNGRGQLVFDLERVLSPIEMENLYGDKELMLSWTEYKKRRSLNANAYHWTLCGKLAYKLGISVQEVHKDLILKGSAYSVTDGVADWVVYPAKRKIRADEYLRKIGETTLRTKKGKVGGIIYLRFKESHLMDTREFAELLSNTIEECKAQGIETLPPEELKRMLDSWKPMAK